MEAIRRTLVAALVVAVVGVWVLPLQAELLDYATFAYIDSNGAWYGATPFGSLSLSGSVDWVVFRPGAFAQAFPGSSYSPPANELVYAYQIVPAGASDVSTLQSAIVSGRPYDDIGTFPLTDQVGHPGLTPTTATFSALGGGYGSAYWYFSGGIPVGDASAGLAYASPNAPEMQFGSLVGSGLGAMADPLPAPSISLHSTPEPSTVILLAAAAILLGIRRRFWFRHASAMRITRLPGVVLVVMLACSGAAMGSMLPLDPNAYNDGTRTWSGTQAFVGPGGLLDVAVDYAVYAPGQFHASTTLGNPTDPSNGSEFVYAYQLNNVGVFNVACFSVGLADAADSDAGKEADKLPANIGFVANFPGDPNGFPPFSEAFTYPSGGRPAQSADWSYSSSLPAGSYSNILIYTSPYPPHTDAATVQAGQIATEGLPSPFNPAPEPASGLLLAVAAVFLLAVRVCRPRR
ncbi:MAG: PEP-CTERM sorting domain-containing protein [Thermoguttaceae bacterium]